MFVFITLRAEFLKWNLPGNEPDYCILMTIDHWLNKAMNSPWADCRKFVCGMYNSHFFSRKLKKVMSWD